MNSRLLEIGSPLRRIVGQLIIQGYLSLLFATNIAQQGFSRGLLHIVVVLLPISPAVVLRIVQISEVRKRA